MKEEIEAFLQRSRKFEENARYNFEKGDYDLTMFHLEQAAQLLVKAKLLDLKGYFERTHSLRRLLSELSEIWEKERLNSFIEENKIIFRDLERAYISDVCLRGIF